jgi:hypothetical protein
VLPAHAASPSAIIPIDMAAAHAAAALRQAVVAFGTPAGIETTPLASPTMSQHPITGTPSGATHH